MNALNKLSFMKCLRTINLLIFCLAFIGCSKQTEYQMMVTSAQSCEVTVTYPDGYWGDLETLEITHNENSGANVVFHPKTIDLNGASSKYIVFNVARPNEKELEWSEDKLSATGHSTLRFKSDTQDIALRFEFSLHFSENKDILGGSSMYVSAVSFGENRIERETHPFNEKFVIDITELVE